MFQESQNVGQDQFFKLIQGNGGTLNGGTWQDGTIYFEVVPNSALEMSLWLEADRMGFLLPTATYDAFLNQQEVVQNEKRQNYDNRPYGQTSYIIGKLLYPEGHPYNWTTIGSLEDLQNATLKDVHDFYKKWYGPNNATLVVAGDFDVDKTKEWIEKYFGSIPSSAPVQSIKPMRVTLNEQKHASCEDNFAQSPELTMLFPTVEQYSKDSYALDILADLLGNGKKSPLYKVIVEEKKLAPSVSTNQTSNEIAGDFRIRVRAFPNVSL
jgi:zinc protease